MQSSFLRFVEYWDCRYEMANTGFEPDTPGKRGLQLTDCFRQKGLWVCLEAF